MHKTILCLLPFLAGCAVEYTPRAAPVITVETAPMGQTRTYVADCPDWSTPSGKFIDHNITHSNYGCATATNLGEMVKEPEDLLEGRGKE